MIVRKTRCALTALKKAYEDDTDVLILDLDESLDPKDVLFAWFKCYQCGEEAHVVIGSECPKKCSCGSCLFGFTADLVIQGDRILYSDEREHMEKISGDPCDGCYYLHFEDCPGQF